MKFNHESHILVNLNERCINLNENKDERKKNKYFPFIFNAGTFYRSHFRILRCPNYQYSHFKK